MRTFRIVFAVVVVLAIAFLAFVAFGNYSTGSRAGTVAKFSRKGIVIKTLEGQLNVGAFTGSEGGYAPETWSFTVRSGEEEVVAQLEQALLDGNRVKLHYREKFVKFPFLGDTQYFVYEVETLPRTPNAQR